MCVYNMWYHSAASIELQCLCMYVCNLQCICIGSVWTPGRPGISITWCGRPQGSGRHSPRGTTGSQITPVAGTCAQLCPVGRGVSNIVHILLWLSVNMSKYTSAGDDYFLCTDVFDEKWSLKACAST
jgi:hypothetical protein